MKDDFPTFPFLSMLFVTAGCTAIGWAIGGSLGDVYGLAIGLLLGYGVFSLLLYVGDEQRVQAPARKKLTISFPWRLDAAAPVLQGPKRWLSQLRNNETKTISNKQQA